MACTRCADTGWVCESHLDRPWAKPGELPNACDCGAGAPCPDCNALHGDTPRPPAGLRVVFDKTGSRH